MEFSLKKVEIFTDGSCLGNPGAGGWCAILRYKNKEKILKGAKKEQFNIEINLGKLKGYHLSLGQIVQAIQSITKKVPNVKGKTKNNQLVVFGVKNAIDSIKDVGNIIVAQYMGSPIYLKDVAIITDGIEIQNKKSAEILIK